MIKSISKLQGVTILNKEAQKNVFGGKQAAMTCEPSCPSGQVAQGGIGMTSCDDITDKDGNVIGLHRCVGSLCLDSFCTPGDTPGPSVLSQS